MTSSPPARASKLANRFGLSERVFVGPNARRLASKIEAGLERVDDRLRDALGASDPVADASTRYLFEAGGKRVRPMLVLLTSELGDGPGDEVIDAAAALELMHLGSLYHDDVMDGADRRRGVPAVHTVWGNQIAILAGDVLLARASSIMSRVGDEAMQLQTETFERLVAGQMRETIGPQPGDDRIEHYLSVLSDKTGSLIAAAAQAGAYFSGAPRRVSDALKAYGERVGVAYQLADDVIDLSADAADTGKVPGTDLRAGVPTMPYLLLRRRDDPEAQQLVQRIDEGVEQIANGADPGVLDGALADLRDHAVTHETKALAREYSQRAIVDLDVLPSGAVKDALARFARSLVERSA